MAGYFVGLASNFSTYITPRKPALDHVLPSPPPGDQTFEIHKGRDEPSDVADEWLSSTKTIDFDELDQSTPLLHKAQQRKRQRPPSTGKATKRRKRDEDAYDPVDDASDPDDLDGSTLLDSPPRPMAPIAREQSEKTASDRKRMPPPLIPDKAKSVFYHPDPKLVDKDLDRTHRIVRVEAEEAELSDDEVFSQKTKVTKSDRREVAYDFNHERARRHADAVELPPDSGYWSNVEKDLFFRLAMRGFEPLIPANWSIDFKTLPISLFAVEGDKPVIEPFDSHQFRAIHYLERLFSIGMRVRDRRVMHLHAEPIIKNTFREYMSWAMKDGGVDCTKAPASIPIYAVKTLRRGEKTQGALDRLTRKLHSIAARFHDAHGIFPSVERQEFDPDETAIGEDYDNRFPIVTGFLICSSIVLVVTLDTDPSRFRPLPTQITHSVTENTGSLDRPQQDHISKGDSGLRFIATFDFSDGGMDVWNGLAIAIVVMRIRKTLKEMMPKAGEGVEMGNGFHKKSKNDDHGEEDL